MDPMDLLAVPPDLNKPRIPAWLWWGLAIVGTAAIFAWAIRLSQPR